MRIKYREPKLSKSNKIRLEQINSIIAEYQADGYVLTLRQLYYQLVSRDIIPNQQKEYAKLSNVLKEGRMGGIVDWNAIEDRLRRPSSPSSWDSPASIIDGCIQQYQLDHMDGQDTYIEVWVEKDALSGVLSRVTRKYHVPIMVNRGYSSASAMHDAFNRIDDKLSNDCSRAVVLYLGDYDPSGIDMIRDIAERILEFANKDYYLKKPFAFQVIPIALTSQQIKKYSPPPNPAKMTDPRAKDYVEQHGKTSWEVDALPPNVLNKVLEDNILQYIDTSLYKEVLKNEEIDRKRLKEIKKYL